jgi:hypothetical protein
MASSLLVLMRRAGSTRAPSTGVQHRNHLATRMSKITPAAVKLRIVHGA